MKILVISDKESEILLKYYNENHYPLRDVGDGSDITHKGYQAIREFVKKLKPKYFIYGHNHLIYGRNDRIINFEETTLINAYEKYLLDYK